MEISGCAELFFPPAAAEDVWCWGACTSRELGLPAKSQCGALHWPTEAFPTTNMIYDVLLDI